jgi:para-aminobenzoate synthetase/4-amino-4-deoxychorismate lyase
MNPILALEEPNSVLLETNLLNEDNSRDFLFTNPVEILVAHTLPELNDLLLKIDSYIESGFYLAGYLSYEAGYLFEEGFFKKWKETVFDFPLAWFGVYKNPIVTSKYRQDKFDLTQADSFKIVSYSLNLNESEYEEKIQRILDYIKKGETYQVNFTIRANFSFEGNANTLYQSLKHNQHVSYSAIINDGKRQILSLSPELFFKRTKDSLVAKPMKGTSPRGKSELDDKRIKEELKNDSKTKAENSMIVDLIRNDFGKISELGTVTVENLMQVEEYETLFQMTSTVKSQIKKDTGYYQLFKAIFPGGSITGAPKYRTMQIIEELESSPRDIYTGAIGFISKDESIFNIAIRTILIENKKGSMGVGSGIVWDSSPKKEFEECLLKQKFLFDAMAFRLIESMLFRNGKIILLTLHLKRLEKSAQFFGFRFNKSVILQKINSYTKKLENEDNLACAKVRIELSRFGEVMLEHSNILMQRKTKGKVKISPIKVFSKNIFQSHKTTIRKIYNEEYSKATKEGFTDYIFLNEKEEVVETSIYNIFVLIGKSFFTPPCSSGALPGVMREYLLGKGTIKEKTLTISDLKSAEKIFLCNSVRGIMRVSLE